MEILKYGYGLTDLVKSVIGNDSSLRKSDFIVSGFRKKILEYAPMAVCFNGKKAAQVYLGTKKVVYGLIDSKICDSLLYVAPSTSGAANRYWDETYWSKLSNLVN